MERGWGKVTRICALNPQSFDGQLLIGMSGGVVAFGSVQEGFCLLFRGHIGERVVVSANPRDHSLVTCGDDGYLHKWSMIQHSAAWSINVEVTSSSEEIFAFRFQTLYAFVQLIETSVKFYAETFWF